MKITRFKTAERYSPEPDWNRVSPCQQECVSLEHFTKPPGHASPKHSHPNAQVLFVLEGKIVVTGESEECELCVGDTIYIPGDEVHVVTNPLDTPSVGIDIFVPGRSFDFWLKKLAEIQQGG